MRRTPWDLVGLLVAAGIIAAFHVGKAPPALPSIRADLDASLRQGGWLLSTVSLVSAVSGVAFSDTAARFGDRRLVLLGTAVTALASLFAAFATSVGLLLLSRVVEGLGIVAIIVAGPTLILRITRPQDHRLAMTIWSTYMPAGAGAMMLVSAIVLPNTSWRAAWIVAAGASAIMFVLLMLRALPRRELDDVPMSRHPVVHEIAETVSSGGPIAIAICFGGYSCCWFAVIGFLPTLQIERLHLATETAAVVTAIVTVVNTGGNLASGWLMRRGVPRVALIVGATLSMGACTVGVFADGVPDAVRLVLAGLYSAVVGVVPAALFSAIPVHAPRPQLVGAATGFLLQGSNLGGLLGPPLTAALVSAGGWPAAAWLTCAALGVSAAAGAFLHIREGRKLNL